MTIKRRLFISNILMIIIPIFLSFATINLMMYVLTGVAGIDNRGTLRDRNEFDRTRIQLSAMTDKLSRGDGLETLEADIMSFNAHNDSISISVYHGKELLYPNPPVVENPVLDIALSQDGEHLFVMDAAAVYRADAGEYTILLTDTNYSDPQNWTVNHPNLMLYAGAGAFLAIIVIILSTNRLLTSFVFKRVITPLDTLAYGVHQIWDGNLEYRIIYTEKDEFAGICEDFNEMAQRLLDSVNARQKDEANRRELIAGISHDLRTPLTSIKAYVEGIEKGVASTPQLQKKYLDTIKSKTGDLEHIVEGLFLFSKLDIGEFPFYMEQVDIGRELANLISNITEEYDKKGLAVVITKNIQDAIVHADTVQLRNVIVNILENSVKYKDKESGKMEIALRTDNETVTISMTDNGPGVPDDTVDKLFDVFYRGDPSRSRPGNGSGLGLATTAKILERLGGSIKAENVPEGGLAIIMTLPKYAGGDALEKNPDC